MSPIKKSQEIKTKKRDNKKSYICVVCCKTCSKRNFRVTGEVTNEILDILLLERDQTHVEESVMCLKCFQKVNIIFEFKAACLYVEDLITPFVSTEEENQIDLKEVYMRQKDNKDLIDALLGRDLCRLCMSVVDNGCVYLDSSELHVKFVKEMIKRCIPEINVNNTKNAIVCGTCVGCLEDFCNFMESYSESRSSSRSQTTGRSLEADTELAPLPKNSSASSSNRASTSTLIEGVCPLGRESSSQIYQCDFCDYKSKLKYRIKSHIRLIHKNPLEMKWFKCSLCDYKSKRKANLKRHALIHKNPWEIEWFKCHLCDFEANSKENLKKHTFIHEESSEFEWFQCDSCDYKSKWKGNLKLHTLIHKRPRETKWFKCHLCDFKANRKDNLNMHTLIHKKPSEIYWFKCHLCDYKAKLKTNLKRHRLIHENPYEMKWFKCHLCDFKAKRKDYLKKHTLIHRKSSEFECHLCDYKAKLKANLKSHMMLLHKNLLGIAWLECDLCAGPTREGVR
ncbi:hypothetical protein NQ315_015555 [Exocentrus adspersus]|uniref:C2H2-type domain-containing protein n=1 Tax=Exocentrus adspersus TaxID=1586481 RepID=A0AAV8V5Z5_9CUCU|nr:hypothetical protein NQ315_015555 [Exocentrus adspersus]